jgi:hypothetical protein
VDGLIGAPVSWEHADGSLPAWLRECSTTGQMRERVQGHTGTFGSVVDAFRLGDRLYASVKLNDGVRIPKPIADWLETSLSDICWPTPGGYAAPEVIELSGTSEAARPGCRVVSQLDPREFRRNMEQQESVLSKMSEQQRAAVHKMMALLENNPDARDFAALVPPELRSAIGAEFAAIITGLEQARKVEEAAAAAAPQQPPQPAAVAASGAAAAAGGSDRTQQLEQFARELATQQLVSYGVPEQMATSHFERNDPTSVKDLVPMLLQCSAAALRRAGVSVDDAGDAQHDPEPPRKMQRAEPQMTREELSAANLARVKQFKGMR